MGKLKMPPAPNSLQIRAARAALGWSSADLAQASGITRRTLQKAENDNDESEVRTSTRLAIKATLEAAGIEFIEAEDGAPGIIIRTAQTD